MAWFDFSFKVGVFLVPPGIALVWAT